MLYQVTVAGDATKSRGFGEVAFDGNKSTLVVRMDSSDAAKWYVRATTQLPVIGVRLIRETRTRR